MSSNRVVAETEQDLYRKMKCSPGGIMLLVRLYADLAEHPRDFVLRLTDLDSVPDPSKVLPRGSQLAITYGWLERKFGRPNARRAVIETAQDIFAPRIESNGNGTIASGANFAPAG